MGAHPLWQFGVFSQHGLNTIYDPDKPDARLSLITGMTKVLIAGPNALLAGILPQRWP